MEETGSRIDRVPAHLRAFAKGQRSAMTRAERLFWQEVRAGRLGGYKFKRQVPIAPYIADFLCSAVKLVIELDGPPHQGADSQRLDRQRDAWFAGRSFRVLRLSNDEVLGNCDRVLATVLGAIRTELAPSPAPLCGAPSPAEGGEGGRDASPS